MRTWLASLTGIALLLGTVRADASALSRARTREGYALAYDLQFAACYAALEQAAAADPLDPAPPRAMAAVTWIEILFSQGVATFEAFTGELSQSDVARPAVPPSLTERFRIRIAQARTLAAQQLLRIDDADAQYQSGATDALAALYGATVEGRVLGSFTQGRRAVAAMERARTRDPGKHEAALVLGMSQYTVSTMSWPVRMLAKLSGLSGSREAGLALLEEAAAPGADTQSDALMLLMIVDNREGRHQDAITRLKHLQDRHAGNRLLWLNHGAAALSAGRPLEAEQALSAGMAGHPLNAAPTVLGETALWFSHRGTALVRLHRRADAIVDLQRGLSSDPRDWVRGRLHIQLGDLALETGDRPLARREYRTAIEASDRGGDREAAKDTKRKLNALGREPA